MEWKKNIINRTIGFLKRKKINKRVAFIILIFTLLFAYFLGWFITIFSTLKRRKVLAFQLLVVLCLIIIPLPIFLVGEKEQKEESIVGSHLYMKKAWENEIENTNKTIERGNKLSNIEQFVHSPGKNRFMIKVNTLANCITVYTYDESGEYTIPVKAFVCSTGKEESPTPLGTFRTADKYEWCLMVDSSWAQYAYRINGPIMLHSVPYFSRDKSDLEFEEYNKLGNKASMGCIRLAVEDIKWIYENCKQNTIVEVYEDIDPGPLGKPESEKIPYGTGWDPTDPDENNPFHN